MVKPKGPLNRESGEVVFGKVDLSGFPPTNQAGWTTSEVPVTRQHLPEAPTPPESDPGVIYALAAIERKIATLQFACGGQDGFSTQGPALCY